MPKTKRDRGAPLPLARPSLAPVAVSAILALLPGPDPVAGQEGDGGSAVPRDSLATLSGQVVSAMTGGPLPDARVVLRVAGRGAFTSEAGRFRIADVRPGQDTIRVSLVGFADQQMPLEIVPGRETRATFLLSETVLRLEDITVEVEGRDDRASGKLRGFWQRREHGMGHYITPEMIEERNPQEPADLLRMVPGVRVGATRLGRTPVEMSRRSGRSCEPTIFLDGSINRRFSFDDLNVADLAAIEIYRGPSETPSRFSFSESCGVILVWTHEGGSR